VLAELLAWNPPTLAQIENVGDSDAQRCFAGVGDVAEALRSSGQAQSQRRNLIRDDCAGAGQLVYLCEGSRRTLRSVSVELPNTAEGLAALALLPRTVVELSFYWGDDESGDESGEGNESPPAALSLASFLGAGHALPGALLHLEIHEQLDADIAALLETPIARNLLLLNVLHDTPRLSAASVRAIAATCRSLRHLGLTCGRGSDAGPDVLHAISASGLPFLESLELTSACPPPAVGELASAPKMGAAHLGALAKGCAGLRQLVVDYWGFGDVASAFEATANGAEDGGFRALARLSVRFGNGGVAPSAANYTVAMRLVAAVPSLRVLANVDSDISRATWAAQVAAAMRRNNEGRPCCLAAV
jgi:hypothetical protein